MKTYVFLEHVKMYYGLILESIQPGEFFLKRLRTANTSINKKECKVICFGIINITYLLNLTRFYWSKVMPYKLFEFCSLSHFQLGIFVVKYGSIHNCKF